jgi:hypothetical protein
MPTLPRINRSSPVRLVPITQIRTLHRLLLVALAIQLCHFAFSLLRFAL